MKKLFFTLMTCVLALGIFVGCNDSGSSQSQSEARTIEEIQASGKIIIGVFSDKKPFGYVDANGEYQGYDVYFGNRIAKDLGVEVEYVPVEAASRVEYLVSNKVDITLPYMKVALGVVSSEDNLITDVAQLNGKTLIVSKGTTAETYFTENHPEVNLLKFDQYSEAYNALLDGRGDALSTDNTEVLAWALENEGFSVGIDSLGNIDTIAAAVQKGNEELLSWLNNEIVQLGEENFFHAAYEETLAPVYGEAANADSIVIEGGQLQ